MNIIINGINSNSAGGLSILSNFIKIVQHKSEYKVKVMMSRRNPLFGIMPKTLEVIEVPVFLSSGVLSPIIYENYIDKLLIANKADLVINFGDLIINTKIKQIYFFDWAYLIYPESVVWKLMSPLDNLNRYIKRSMIASKITLPAIVTAQTDVAESRLRKIYDLDNIRIVPNAVSLDNLRSIESDNSFYFGDKINLLYLTRYYPHKNLEILLDVASLIKQRGLNYQIVTTIDSSQSKQAKKFLYKIKSNDLSDIINNIGSVSMAQVPSLYSQCDALLMPTLLESFSGTYVEALYHKIPIFTSDLDFARSICGNSAFYFDPFCANNILDTIESSFSNPGKIEKMCSQGFESLSKMNTWEVSASKLLSVCDELIQRINNDD